MRSVILLRLAAALSVLLLSACASTPQRQAFNRGAEQVESVRVLQMRESEIDLMILNNPGYSFGLIGVAIAESNRVPKRNALRTWAQTDGFDHVQAFRVALDAALAERGYAVLWPDPPMEGNGARRAKRDMHGNRKAYGTTAEADAQLDVNFGLVGYVAAGSGDNAPYRPTAVLSARLVSADGERVLFSDSIVYNNAFGQQHAITLDPDDRFVYPDFDDLEAEGVGSIEGLRIAIDAVAAELARQL